MKSFAAPLAVVLIACGLVNQVSASKTSSKNKINKYLESHVNSTDVEANFAAAKELLGQLEKEHHIFGSNRIKMLKQLSSVFNSLDDCWDYRFQVIDDLSRQWPEGRISEVLKKAKTEHDMYCLSELRERFASHMAQVEPEALELVKKYTEIVKKYIPDAQVQSVEQSLRGLLIKGTAQSFNNSDYNQEVLAFAKSQPQVDNPQSPSSDSHLIFTSIIEPCELYFRELRLTDILINRLISSKVEIDQDLEEDLYRFKVCSYVHDKERDPNRYMTWVEELGLA